MLVLWRTPGQDGPRTVRVEDVNAERARLIGPELGPYTPGAGTMVALVNGALDLALSERPLFVVYDEGSAASDQKAKMETGQASAGPAVVSRSGDAFNGACGLALVPLLLAACGVVLAWRKVG